MQGDIRAADQDRDTRYAHHFDPERRAAPSSALKAALDALYAPLESQEAALGIRQRRRSPAARVGFRAAIEAIACNILAVAILLGHGRTCEVAVPRSHAAMFPPARYRPRVYGEHFLAALDLMARPEVGLIETVTKGYRYAGSKGQRSTIRATARFWECIPPDLAHQPNALTREPSREVLIRRGHKDPTTGEAPALDYNDTPFTKRWRKEMQALNAHLQAAPIIVLPGATALRDDDGQPIDPTRRTLRRIFNNGSWYEGGRLYDGFWESMRRSDRFEFLRIGTAEHPEGEPIANVDYGQLFPRLAYLRCCPEPPAGDLYDIVGDGLHRDGYKQLLNALLCAGKPLTHWPEEARRAFPPGTKLRETVAAIREHHTPIAYLFGSGVGMRLMLQESTILIATVLRLFGSGVTALPLHDSVLVAASQADVAKAVMEEEFAALTGGGAKVTVSYC